MTTDDGLSEILDEAIRAARQPEGGPAPSAAAAQVLAKAQELSRRPGQDQADPDDVVAFLERARQKADGPAAAPRRAAPRTTTAHRSAGPAPAEPVVAKRPTGLLVAIAVLVVIALVMGAYILGQSSGSSRTASGGTATAAGSDGPVDQAKVDALMAKVASNPDDTASLLSLGNMYYGANDYVTALTFYEKLVAAAPKDENAWIAVAASAYQSGSGDRAFEAWNAALDINPDNIEAHYGLGWYYFEQAPPDEANAKAEWEKVVAIDPDSEQAKTVATHLVSLGSTVVTPSPSTP